MSGAVPPVRANASVPSCDSQAPGNRVAKIEPGYLRPKQICAYFSFSQNHWKRTVRPAAVAANVERVPVATNRVAWSVEGLKQCMANAFGGAE